MSNEITCPLCQDKFKGEANLKRHTTVKHKKNDAIKIVSVPADTFTFNDDLGIYESQSVGFPPGYEIVSVLSKRSMRSAKVGDRMKTHTCVDIVMRMMK